jgi:hypothetical protein
MKRFTVQIVIQVYDDDSTESDVEQNICDKLCHGYVGDVETIIVEEQE